VATSTHMVTTTQTPHSYIATSYSEDQTTKDHVHRPHLSRYPVCLSSLLHMTASAHHVCPLSHLSGPVTIEPAPSSIPFSSHPVQTNQTALRV
jgi:hypothetical protein